MNATYRAWRAGFTRRWHTNFDLCDTVDCDAGHQGRVAILVLSLFPKASRELLIMALVHDQGEVAVGDLPYATKRANPALANMAHELESAEIFAQGLPDYTLSNAGQKALKLCDNLDAWLWMIRHKPRLVGHSDWVKMLIDMRAQASQLGVKDEVAALTTAAVEAAL